MSISNLLTSNLKTFQHLKVNEIEAPAGIKTDNIENQISSNGRTVLGNYLEMPKLNTYTIDIAVQNFVTVTTQCGIVSVSNMGNVNVDAELDVVLNAASSLIDANTICLVTAGPNGSASDDRLIPSVRQVISGALDISLSNVTGANHTTGNNVFSYFLL